ncbi:transcriptional regulator family: Fungal Specific TF [Trichoderma aggressivum f. europaeum]|uniref:Transcriptional regulator family: Fungal Specific TF n=1 Tax=Trichoderma aggressivum f. europaeum TaxID=173218 RepID=A0AAE1J0R6_9HYPO|nr:transcriptional regulator family: Fungal Specific TF [Trichoderma aggressivum f. europaeum]
MSVGPDSRIDTNPEPDRNMHSPSWNFPIRLSMIPPSITAVNSTRQAPSCLPFKRFTSPDSSLQMLQRYLDVPQNRKHGVPVSPRLAAPTSLSTGGDCGHTQSREKPSLANSPQRLLWLIGRAEAARLCDVYEREIGTIYPVVDMSEVKQILGSLYSAYEAANYSSTSPVPVVEELEDVADGDVETLKLVLAIALLAEGGGRHTMGEAICEEVQQQLVFPMGRLGELKDIENMALLGVSFYLMNDENQAWRMIGLAARLCIELGLHQANSSYEIHHNSKGSIRALALFWDIYILDRRFSLSTGRPFAIQDADIDPALPKPDDLSPYVRSMIAFASMGSRVRASRVCFEGNGSHCDWEEIAYLDFQIQHWSDALPSSLRLFKTQSCSLEDESLATAINTPLDFAAIEEQSLFLRALLHLRANDLRILIHRPALHSSDSIQKNPLSARTAVNVARRSLNLLLYLCRLPTLHPMHHVCATHFLASSLTVLLLAVSHAPEDLGAEVRDQLLSALSFLEDLSTSTTHSESLWYTVRNYRDPVKRLGEMLQENINSNRATPAKDAFTSPKHNDEGFATYSGTGGLPVFDWDITGGQALPEEWFNELQEPRG